MFVYACAWTVTRHDVGRTCQWTCIVPYRHWIGRIFVNFTFNFYLHDFYIFKMSFPHYILFFQNNGTYNDAWSWSFHFFDHKSVASRHWQSKQNKRGPKTKLARPEKLTENISNHVTSWTTGLKRSFFKNARLSFVRQDTEIKTLFSTRRTDCDMWHTVSVFPSKFWMKHGNDLRCS